MDFIAPIVVLQATKSIARMMSSEEKVPLNGHISHVSDIEAQERCRSAQVAPEYTVPSSTKYTYLALYFGLNLLLTLYNKAVLGKVRRLSTIQSIVHWRQD